MLFYAPAFIFAFLPVALTGYFLLGKRRPDLARIWLLGASLLFYFLGDSSSLAVLLASVVGNFYLARMMAAGGIGPVARRWLLAGGVSLNLGLLAYYKCLGLFSLPSVESGHGYFLDILIPLGLSFFTLQQIAFLVDTYRGEIREKSLLRYSLFVSFFPQLIAGPIVRYQEMVPQLERDETFRFSYENLAVGSFIFILGALKKLLIADSLAPVANVVFADAAQGHAIMMVDAWLGCLSFYLQLYFDFSAYSDMAIGAARMFGITLPINFNSPYQSRSLPQVFLRWHITLYRFLSDYLLFPMITLMKKVPLGSNAVRTRVAVSLSIITIFCLSGLWHGAALSFLLWGLINGLAIALIYLGKELGIIHRSPGGAKGSLKGLAATFLFCLLAAVVFRSQSLDQVGTMFRALAGLNGVALPLSFEPLLGGLGSLGITFQEVLRFPELGGWSEKGFFYVVLLGSLGIVWLAPNIYELTARHAPALGFHPKEAGRGLPPWMRLPSPGLAVAMALAAVLMFSLVLDPGGTGSSTFIYFHF